MINYYVVLEIPNFSNQLVIKKAYRTLSKKYHPDVNNDPFAGAYFLKINEAYNFLIDDNKRMLLHQFLSFNHINNQTTSKHQAKYQEKPSQNNWKNNTEVEPVIHLFIADKKHFMVNDHILLQWNVSQCQSVSINVFGNVSLAGTHYLKVDHYAEEIIVLMTVLGLNNKEYKYQIKLFYDNRNPSTKAFHKIKAQFPEVDEIHFKKETFFGLNARINKSEFTNRMILLLSLLILTVIFFFIASVKVLFFLLILFLLWVIFGQSYKRLHDTERFKNKTYLLFIPIYNLFIIKKLFVLESENVENIFGVVPQNKNISFKNWILNGFKRVNKQLTLLQKISMGSFLLLVTLVTFKVAHNYEEVTAELTSYYINTSRPTTNGSIHKDFFVVFNDKIPVNVSENYFDEIVYQKEFDTFKIARNTNNKIEYIRLINSKNNNSERINFGVFKSDNPLLLIAFLLFLSQLYVWRNLKAPNETTFSNYYMVFVMLVYVYGIFLILFK